MPAIITNDLRIANGDYFQNDVSDIPTYIYFGGTTAWNDPDVPDDAVDSTEGRADALRDVIGLKRIDSTDIMSVLPRNDWASGTVYDEYTDAANIIDDKNPVTNDFYRFYVVTDEFNVYKCISNNGRAVSTTKPSGTSTSNFQTPDGYIWKYMYTIKSSDAFKFMTPNWVPCYSLYVDDGSTQWDVQQAAVPGTIDHITVQEVGSGYDPLNPPTINITGDGTGASATAEIDDTTGEITKIVVTDPGSGYTTADITITSGTGSGGTARAVLSPINGHGSDARSELGAVYKMIRVTIDGDENGILPINVDYRRSGVVIEPKSQNSGIELYVADTSFYQVGDTVTGATSGATGTVVSLNKVKKIIYINNVTGTFTVGENISSNALNTVQLQYITNTNELPLVNPVIVGTDYKDFTGKPAYVANRTKITRGTNQIEEFRFVIQF